MKVKTNLLLALFSLFVATTAFAEISIKAQVDKTSITTDETLTYKLVIISSEKNTPVLEIPKFNGFAVLSQAQSVTASFAKRKAETQFVYVFILGPREAGKLKIEPGTVKIGGSIYTSEQFAIEVTQGKAKPQIPSGEEPTEPQISLL